MTNRPEGCLSLTTLIHTFTSHCVSSIIRQFEKFSIDQAVDVVSLWWDFSSGSTIQKGGKRRVLLNALNLLVHWSIWIWKHCRHRSIAVHPRRGVRTRHRVRTSLRIWFNLIASGYFPRTCVCYISPSSLWTLTTCIMRGCICSNVCVECCLHAFYEFKLPP